MTPELKERLEQAAQWHEQKAAQNSVRLLADVPNIVGSFHSEIAADIRAAIVSADDQTRNMLTLRAWKANQRKYEQDPVSITGFDQLEGQS